MMLKLWFNKFNRDNDGFQITIGGKGFNTILRSIWSYINRGDQDPSNNINIDDTFLKSIDSDSGENLKYYRN